jgi:hypothetical protein
VNFTVIQNKVLDRLNLTSAQATARVADSINESYRWMASKLGLNTIERQSITANTVIGSQSIVFNCERIISVFNPQYSPVFVLAAVSYDEMRNMQIATDPPSIYAISLMGASTVTVLLNTIPASVYSLGADAMVNLITLSGVMVPAFSEDFHDILLYHPMAVELEKMEKYDKADEMEKKFEKRFSEYLLYVAVSAYQDIYQGKTTVALNTSPTAHD